MTTGAGGGHSVKATHLVTAGAAAALALVVALKWPQLTEGWRWLRQVTATVLATVPVVPVLTGLALCVPLTWAFRRYLRWRARHRAEARNVDARGVSEG